MTTGDSRCYYSFCDTGCYGAFDDGCYGVHRSDDFVLELWWDVEFDLLEEIFRCTEATYNQDILKAKVSILLTIVYTPRKGRLPGVDDSALESL